MPHSVHGFQVQSDIALEHMALNVLHDIFPSQTGAWSCPEQWQAFFTLLHLQQDVVMAMGMGSGKTFPMILCSQLEHNKATIVILPLISLMTDYVDKLTKWKIPFHKFLANNPIIPSSTQLILVTAETITMPSFKKACMLHHQQTPIVRACFDEAQLALYQADFCFALRTVSNLCFHDQMQLVVLSSTMPVRSIPELKEQFYLTDNPIIIRTTTNHPNLKFVLKTFRPSINLVSVVSELRQTTYRIEDTTGDPLPFAQENNTLEYGPWIDPLTWLHMDQAYHSIFFVPRYELGEKLEEEIGNDFYHGDNTKLTEAAREQMFHAWKNNQIGDIIATSAMGQGGDCQDVYLIVHVDTPTGLGSCLQECNRGGRDGHVCVCYILAQDTRSWRPSKGNLDHNGAIDMHKLIWSSRACLRYVFTLWVDGVGVCCLDNAENQRCSHCEAYEESEPHILRKFRITPFPTMDSVSTSLGKRCASQVPDFAMAYKSSKRRTEEQYSHMDEYNAHLKGVVDALEPWCTYCLSFGDKVAKHNVLACPKLFQKGVIRTNIYLDFRQTLKYRWRNHLEHICPRCHLHSGNNTVHIGDLAHGCNPKHSDLIGPAVFGVYMSPSLYKAGEQHFGITNEWNTTVHYSEWLMDKVKEGDKDPSQILAVFMWAYQYYTKNVLE